MAYDIAGQFPRGPTIRRMQGTGRGGRYRLHRPIIPDYRGPHDENKSKKYQDSDEVIKYIMQQYNDQGSGYRY